MKISTEKKQKCKRKLKESLITLQLHGLPKIISSTDYVIKLMWSFSFLISFCICLYFLIQNVNTYLQYSTVNNIDFKSENSMVFPTIKICPIYQTVKNYSLSDTLVICLFGQILNCSNEFYFKKYFDNFLNKYCYIFNHGQNNTPLLKSTRPGPYHGLFITLFDGLTNDPRQIIFENIEMSNGLHVFINSKSDRTSSGFHIYPGKATLISISKKVVSKLSVPYNDCIKDLNTYYAFNTALYDEITSSNYTYHQTDCLDYAFLKFNNCSISYERQTENCIKGPKLKEITNKFFTYYSESKFKTYLPLCPLECDSISYSVQLSQSYYPSEEESKRILNNWNLMSKFPPNSSVQEVKKTLYPLRFYFEELKYESISDQPKMDTWTLVSSFGGILGLFLGFSFLSLVDFIQIMIELICILKS
jgi:hypothetical protein